MYGRNLTDLLTHTQTHSHMSWMTIRDEVRPVSKRHVINSIQFHIWCRTQQQDSLTANQSESSTWRVSSAGYMVFVRIHSISGHLIVPGWRGSREREPPMTSQSYHVSDIIRDVNTVHEPMAVQNSHVISDSHAYWAVHSGEHDDVRFSSPYIREI